MPTVEGESHSGDLPEYLDTDVASSSNTAVFSGSNTAVFSGSNTAEKDENVDLMSYSNNEMPLDNLIHGSMELPSEFARKRCQSYLGTCTLSLRRELSRTSACKKSMKQQYLLNQLLP